MFLVLLAYTMGAFPGMEDTPEHATADRLLVDSFSHTRLYACFTRIKQGKGGGDGDREKESSRVKKWKICFEKFLMSLADQQLVMSLAIPVAVFTRWSKTSLFSLDMALTLVFTSLVTHLATIRYCPGYLLEHKVMSGARIFAIGAVIGCTIALRDTRGATVYAAQKYYAATHNITESPSTPFTWAVLPACFLRQNPGLPPDWGYDILRGVALVLYFANLPDKLFSRKLQSTSFLYRFIMIYVLRQEGEKLGVFNDFARLYGMARKRLSILGVGDEQSGIRPRSDYNSDTALDTHSHPVRYHCRAIRQRYRNLLALPVELVSSRLEATSQP
jgi:hypothetical protein